MVYDISNYRFMGDTQQQTQLIPTDPWFLASPMFDGYFMEDHGGMEVSSFRHGGSPSLHPFSFRIFHEINHPAIGDPMNHNSSQWLYFLSIIYYILYIIYYILYIIYYILYIIYYILYIIY